MQALFVRDINMRKYMCVCSLCGAKLIGSFAVVLPAAYVLFAFPAAYVLQEMCLCVCRTLSSRAVRICAAHSTRDRSSVCASASACWGSLNH